MGRVDNRKSSSPNCSTVTIVVFVALCLVGLWMMTSSVVVPVGNVEMSPEETNAEVKKQVEIVNEPQRSEESLDGVVKDASTIPEVKQNVSPAEKMIEIQIEEVKEENSVKENEERKNIPNDVTGNGAGNESNGTLETAISKEPVEASKPETWGESNDTTKTEIASESDDSPRKEIVNESNDDSKIETRSESDETLRKETANESNVDSRIETIIESDHTLGKETANESNNDSKTETGNESDNAFKKETGNESNDASKTETGNESDRALRKESLNESNDDSKTETGNESDRALKKESLNESNDDSKTEIGNESDETSKTEKKNERNEKAENEETNMESGEVDSKGKESNTEGSKTNENGQADGQDRGETNSESEESSGATGKGENVPGKIQEMVEQNQGHEYEQNSSENKTENQTKDQRSNEVFLDPTQSELLNETSTQNGAFSTQAMESKNEKEAQQLSSSNNQTVNKTSAGEESDNNEYNWKLCNATAAQDYIPCLDNGEAIKKLKTTKHYEHRERHCPEEGPTCLVPLPNGYKQPVLWPSSRDKIWYYNVPHTQLAQVKGHQNWVKYTGEFLTFPGGGTQFKHGALHYIDFIQESLPNIAWGRQSRVVLDVGCGVASFGGYLFERDVVTMSFAPKDEHEAQVQFALERGIPAISAVMGTKRLPFPSKVFDIVHCARCRVPWHIEGGKLLLELNRVIRPGGYFVWSATPVYQKKLEDVEIWNAMSSLTKSMCWDLMTKVKDPVNRVGIAVYKKPSSNHCYQKRVRAEPPLCEQKDDPDAAWNVPLQACVHQVPVAQGVHGSQWPEQWPQRLLTAPLWLNDSQVGVYGKPAPEDFKDDYKHWKHAVSNTYLNGMGIDWSKVRNVMDMRSVYGGFAAALSDLHMWVMNVVTIDSPDTLPIIYERGLFGIYHDWCESFSTYPRTYDLLHADHLFSRIKKRCELLPVIVEVDRILRPEGNLIVRDNVEILNEIEKVGRSLKWEIRLIQSKDNEGLLCMQKSMWRPQEIETSTSSVA